MSKIKKFIQENNLSFNIGNRNSTVVILIGYSQYLDLKQSKLKEELSDEIKKDEFINEEIDRLWDYCKINNYKKYWTSKEAVEQYKF